MRMSESENGNTKLTLPLSDIDRTALSVVGGTAANLSELTRAGLQVPRVSA
jgi:phosphoenolpyruvate synthase/pyruvate phosphate dikinase